MPIVPASNLSTPALLDLKADLVGLLRELNEAADKLYALEPKLDTPDLLARFDQTLAHNKDIGDRIISRLDEINAELNIRFK